MASQSTQPSSSMKKPNILPVPEAYDQWASTYDIDGNFLQAIDTMMVAEMLPTFISLLQPSPTILDLGCGTGRNTSLLMQIPKAQVIGLDVSANMIAKAKHRCQQALDSVPTPLRASAFTFKLCDISSPAAVNYFGASAVVSTLVMEHVPLEKFFAICYKVLAPGGMLLITNMHSDMGAISQAGFVDEATGEKIQTKSYFHTILEVEEQIRLRKFEVIWKEERAVHEGDLAKIGERGRKWIGVKVWFGMIVRKKV
ncbi:MAG: hypothetical protein Q9218_006615 [Villophora microphyllina]